MKRILIVDDNLATLKQIGALLSGEYDISLAKSGAVALQILEKESPDLILLDVEMPEMDGFQTIAKIKENPAREGLPVIFLTGNNDTETEVRALESGAMDFVTKPITKDILRHRLELHLNYAAYRTSLENQVKSLEDSIVVSFSNLVDRKDTNTGEHVIRTAQIARIIGTELVRRGTFPILSAEDVDKIARATPFHDIGKVGISDLLLMKPAELTRAEYEKVKQHTTIGADLIRTIRRRTPALNYLSFAETIAEYHHERWDGEGYPRGLKGDDIPLCARIVTVANEYDGCTTERAFRKAMSYPDAKQHILDGAGSRFDPRVVDAFIAVYEKCVAVSAADAALLLNPVRVCANREQGAGSAE